MYQFSKQLLTELFVDQNSTPICKDAYTYFLQFMIKSDHFLQNWSDFTKT
jgi:hypothetical protein